MPSAPSQNEQAYLTAKNMDQKESKINNFFHIFFAGAFPERNSKKKKWAFFRPFLVNLMFFYRKKIFKISQVFTRKKGMIFLPRFSLTFSVPLF